MIELAANVINILPVTDIRSTDGAVELTLNRSLKARWPTNHPDHEIYLHQAEWSLEQGRPIGVILDATGKVVELKIALETHVQKVMDDTEDSTRVEVWFWAYSPVCYLTRDHPEFERIRPLLEQAVASNKMVWLATYPWPVESETEIWTKIMDVRPVDQVQVNGTT